MPYTNFSIQTYKSQVLEVKFKRLRRQSNSLRARRIAPIIQNRIYRAKRESLEFRRFAWKTLESANKKHKRIRLGSQNLFCSPVLVYENRGVAFTEQKEKRWNSAVLIRRLRNPSRKSIKDSVVDRVIMSRARAVSNPRNRVYRAKRESLEFRRFDSKIPKIANKKHKGIQLSGQCFLSLTCFAMRNPRDLLESHLLSKKEIVGIPPF